MSRSRKVFLCNRAAVVRKIDGDRGKEGGLRTVHVVVLSILPVGEVTVTSPAPRVQLNRSSLFRWSHSKVVNLLGVIIAAFAPRGGYVVTALGRPLFLTPPENRALLNYQVYIYI